MPDIDLNQVILGLPNFIGLVVCIGILYRLNSAKQVTIDRLIDVIVKKENCD